MKMMCSFERSIHVVLPNRHFVSSLWRNELSESTSCFPPGNALDALRPRVGFIPGGIYLCGNCPEVLFPRPENFQDPLNLGARRRNNITGRRAISDGMGRAAHARAGQGGERVSRRADVR